MNYDFENARNPAIGEVRVADGEKLKIDQVGDLKCKIGCESKTVTLTEVQHIPKLCVNLLSISQIAKKGFTIVFDAKGVRIYSENKTFIASGQLIDGLFQIKIEVNENAHAVGETKRDESTLWHRRLGHANYQTLSSVLNIAKPDTKCVVCTKGKHARSPFNEKGTRATQILQIIHSDVCEMSAKSHGGHRYFVTFVDDYSRKVFIFILKSKGEVFSKFVEFKKQIENQTEKTIKILRSDKGKEYENTNFNEFCKQNGIVQEFTAGYSPQQNGMSERMNRTIVEKVRCMLIDAKLNKQFWAEAAHAAVNVINVLPCASTQMAPNERWFGRKCNLANFKVFGCPAMVWKPNVKRTKLDEKSYECIFLRYADNAKAYRLYDLNTKKIVISRDVVFMEENMTKDDTVNENSEIDLILFDTSADTNDNSSTNTPESTIDAGGNVTNQENESTVTGNTDDSITEFHDADLLNDTTDDVGARDTSVDDPSYNTRARIDPDARKPNTRNHADNDELLAGLHAAFIVGEPQSYKQALQSEEGANWKAAMRDEYDSLIKNHTWELTDRPQNTTLVDNKWVFKIKEGGKNSPSIFKARLVARGFTQEHGINYHETFSPVVRFTSIRAILATAAQRKMTIRQFDVKTAFLNGDLKEVVYMEQPIGFTDGTKRVCRLKKSLYRLKQASRCWNEKFTGFIKKFGFIQCNSDPCVFVSKRGNETTILAIYVDDGIIVGDNENEIRRVIIHLREKFEIKEMKVDCFLGLEINQNEDGSIFLYQTRYAKKVLKRFDMAECDGVITPSNPNQQMCNFDESDQSSFPYRKLIGSLMYLSIGTRADIAHAVGIASRYVEKPTVVHERAGKRILKYIKKHLNFGILFFSSSTRELSVYTDADYAGDIDTRRSTSGSAFIYSGGIISWSSTRQKSVSASTTESEYIAASLCVRELTWLRALFCEILGEKLPIINLYMDNQSAIRLIKNPEFHKRTKHIDVAYHIIREKYNEELFTLQYISTNEMLADVFTKALTAQVFHYLI